MFYRFSILSLSIILILILSSSFIHVMGYQEEAQRGSFSIYFREEKVGYEEYTWQPEEWGFSLSVSGRITKPTAMEIERLTIGLDKNLIPNHYFFKGSVSGVAQEISSKILDGTVENTIRVQGQEQKSTVHIKRDALLLPNAVFSPYIVLTKKFRCSLEEPIELSAYIIPQLEAPFILEPKEEASCSLIMRISGLEIELETDEEGNLSRLAIPSQKLKVVQDSFQQE